MLDTTNNFLQELDNPTVDKYKFTFKNSNNYKNSVNIYVNGILVAQKHNSQADYGRASGRGNGSRLSQGSKTMMSVHWVMSGLKKLNPTLPLKGTNVFYDVRVNGGYCNKGSGMKGETDFHGNSYYGKIIYAQQETLEKIN